MTNAPPPEGNRAIRNYRAALTALEERDQRIRDRDIFPNETDLLTGSPFYGDSSTQDRNFWVANQIAAATKNGLAPGIVEALDAVNAAGIFPTVDNDTSALRLLREQIAIERLAEARLAHPYLRRLETLDTRAVLYLWACRDTEASYRVAWLAYGQVMLHPHRSPEYLRALSVAHLALGERTVNGSMAEAGFKELSQALFLHRAAKKIVADTVFDDEEADHLQLVPEDRAEYADSAPRWEPKPKAGIVVVPTFPVTTKTTPTGGLSSSSQVGLARREFEHLAGKRLPCVGQPDIMAAAEELREEFPWLETVIYDVLASIVGGPFTKLPNLLFVGPAGSGKTRFARALCEALWLPVTVYGVAGESDGAFKGTSRQWSTGRPSVPLQTVLRSGVANCAMIYDEIEKGGASNNNGRFEDSVLTFLEPESARAVFDPYLELDVDLSGLSHLATANGIKSMSKPLLDRFRIVEVGEPGFEHLGTIVNSILDELREERKTDDRWLPDLAEDELNLLRVWRGGSIRPLKRMVKTLVAGRDALAPRH